MEFKKLISAALMLGAISFGATTASALSSFVAPLNAALGGTSVSCSACHAGAGQSKTNATLPMALTWKSSSLASNLANSDSDGDGFTNIQEASGALLNFNDAAVSPFTLASAGATAADTVLANVVVKGDAVATQQAFADPYSLAGTGEEIVGGISVTIHAVPVTIFVKGLGVDSTMNMYAVDAAGQGTLAPTTSWMANVDGSFTVNAMATNPATVVLVRTLPAAAAVAAASSSSGGCVTSAATTPLMMVLAMLTLGFFVRRKKD